MPQLEMSIYLRSWMNLNAIIGKSGMDSTLCQILQDFVLCNLNRKHDNSFILVLYSGSISNPAISSRILMPQSQSALPQCSSHDTLSISLRRKSSRPPYKLIDDNIYPGQREPISITRSCSPETNIFWRSLTTMAPKPTNWAMYSKMVAAYVPPPSQP